MCSASAAFCQRPITASTKNMTTRSKKRSLSTHPVRARSCSLPRMLVHAFKTSTLRDKVSGDRLMYRPLQHRPVMMFGERSERACRVGFYYVNRTRMEQFLASDSQCMQREPQDVIFVCYVPPFDHGSVRRQQVSDTASNDSETSMLKKHVLCHRHWNADDWTASDDRVRGGKSQVGKSPRVQQWQQHVSAGLNPTVTVVL